MNKNNQQIRFLISGKNYNNEFDQVWEKYDFTSTMKIIKYMGYFKNIDILRRLFVCCSDKEIVTSYKWVWWMQNFWDNTIYQLIINILVLLPFFICLYLFLLLVLLVLPCCGTFIHLLTYCSTVEISIFWDISGDISPLNYSANDGPTCERA